MVAERISVAMYLSEKRILSYLNYIKIIIIIIIIIIIVNYYWVERKVFVFSKRWRKHKLPKFFTRPELKSL
jgi:hypothetical protein